MATYPRDQFDTLPDDLLRVGAHRGPKVKGRGWITFAWAALATGVLVGAGLFGLARVDSSFKLDLGSSTLTATATPTPTPTVTPITDPTTITARDITITVLNGTAVSDLQSTAATLLEGKQWTVGSAATSTETTIKTTTIYYSDVANEDVALGVERALGVGDVQFSDAYPGAPITIVLGSDFPPKS
jgi:hypothetical protein